MNTQVIQPPPLKPRRGSFDALRPLVMAAALLVVLVLAVVVAAWLMGPNGSDGHKLTVEKPVGGTLTGNGITCGTGGTSCTTSFKDGQVIELRPEADAGYTFAGFTLDCRPIGRLEMKAARSCGARFDRTGSPQDPTNPTVTDGRSWPLTLTAPENGTIVTAYGHECGPNKKACTAEVPEGTIAALDVLPEAGYRVQSYTGDCGDGTANMTRARTCGVVLVRGEGPGPSRPSPPTTDPKRNVGNDPKRTLGNETKSVGTESKPTDVPTASATTTSVPAEKPPTNPDSPPPPLAPSTSGLGPVGNHEAAVKLAHTDIQRVLKAYRSAYERMDVAAMKRVQPGLNVKSHELQFKDMKWVKYTFGGDPEIEDLDVVRGEARAIVALKTENEHKSGKKEKPAEGKVTYLLKRIRETPDWEIVLVKYDLKN